MRTSAFSPIVSTPLDLILPSTFPSMRRSFWNLIEPLISTSLGIIRVVLVASSGDIKSKKLIDRVRDLMRNKAAYHL